MSTSLTDGSSSTPHPAGTELRLDAITYVAGRTLLDDVSVTFPAGKVTALSGPSGSGKTTLLSIAGGLLRPSLGEATYAGRPMWQGTGDPRPEVAFVLQVYGLVPILSARENVSVALRARGVDPDEADDRASAALARFHIGDLGDRQVEELSGGQMQRVALARGLCVGAAVLLADEPTSQLSHEDRDAVIGLVHDLGDELGTTIVVVTHQPEVAATFPRTITMKGGRVGLEGRDGAEYVVIGAEGVVHLPTHLAEQWPQGTLVRIEPEAADRLVVSRSEDDAAGAPE